MGEGLAEREGPDVQTHSPQKIQTEIDLAVYRSSCPQKEWGEGLAEGWNPWSSPLSPC